MTDDPLTKAALQEFRRDLARMGERFEDSLTTRLQAVEDSWTQHFAAIKDEEALYRKLADMKLPIDQEAMLYSLLTLPQEALELVKERLGINPQAGIK
jgi:hypothetical protein